MMKDFDMQHMIKLCGAMLPLAILMIENDEDRQFLSDLYLRYEHLMFKIGYDFFPKSRADLEDTIQNAVENLCKKIDILRSLDCNKRSAYIITTVRNSCLARLREVNRLEARRDFSVDANSIDQLPDENDLHSVVFNRVYAMDLLHSFAELTEKEKQLIRIVHMDGLGYGPVMDIYGYTNEGAVRTAVSRAKAKLVELAEQRKWDDVND